MLVRRLRRRPNIIPTWVLHLLVGNHYLVQKEEERHILISSQAQT